MVIQLTEKERLFLLACYEGHAADSFFLAPSAGILDDEIEDLAESIEMKLTGEEE